MAKQEIKRSTKTSNAKMAISFEIENLTKVQNFLKKFPGTHSRRMVTLEEKLGKETFEKVRALAPRDTNYYVSTIQRMGGIVWTTHPAARRLDMGFIGIDSLGRHYTQMPIPHWTTVREEMREKYPTAIVDMTRQAIKDVFAQSKDK